MRPCRLALLNFAALASFLQYATAWQQTGAYATAGFNNARTAYNVDADLAPPLRLVEEVPLDGIASTNSMLVFGGFFLVGENDPEVIYHLHDRNTGERLWTWKSGHFENGPPFVPAYSQGRLLLGSAEGVLALVRVSDGQELWREESIGSMARRQPILTAELAIYNDENKIVAASAETGEEIWRTDLPSAQAPLSLLEDRLYLIGQDLRLHALNVLDGSVVWESESTLPDGCFCSLIAAQSRVFASSRKGIDSGNITAFDAVSGAVQWQAAALPLALPLSLVLAQGRLIAVGGNQSVVRSTALDPDSGAVIYEKTESPFDFGIVPPRFLSVSGLQGHGGVFSYFNILVAFQFRELSTGQLIWSIEAENEPIVAFAQAGSAYYVLFQNRVQVYRPSFERFIPHFANGEEQSTEILIANHSAEAVAGHVEFYDSQGRLIPIPLQSLNQAQLPGFTVESRSALRLATTAAETLQSGWIRLSADGPLQVSSVFRAGGSSGEHGFEAGVADARPLSEATIAVRRQGTLNTAVAIVNPLDAPVFVNMTLKGNGIESDDAMRLLGREHIARFIDELFPDQAVDGFEGALLLEADRPIVVTALRTRNGLQLSSLPVGRQ